MILKKIKSHILISGFLVMFSNYSNAQYFPKNSISIKINAGISQQGVYLGYSRAIAWFQSDSITNRKNQIYLGIEAGRLCYKFQDHRTQGNQLAFSFTNLMAREYDELDEVPFVKYIEIKVGINKFKPLEDYTGSEGFNKKLVTEREIKATDITFKLGRLSQLPNNNFLQVGCFIGARVASYSRNETTTNGTNVSSKYLIDYNIEPLLMGISLGYQFNFGNRK